MKRSELLELAERAKEALAGKSRSYVIDAQDFAPLVVHYVEMLDNLSRCQARCTEMLLALREARVRLLVVDEDAGVAAIDNALNPNPPRQPVMLPPSKDRKK